MKSLLETLTIVNEGKFEGILDQIKVLFDYDNLNYGQKEILADMFRTGHGVIWDQINTFRDNVKGDDPKAKICKNNLSDSLKMCSQIYDALKP